MRRLFSFAWEALKIIIIALVIVIPIRYFLFQPFLVRGQSMEPNFENGDYLIIDEISYRFKEPQRGEVVVFKYPQNLSQRYIKRVIGLPGETIVIKNGEVAIYKERKRWVLDEVSYLPKFVETSGDLQIALRQNEYFVLGDNRPVSSDSRRWGPLPRENIIGRVFFRAWPIPTLARIEVPAY